MKLFASLVMAASFIAPAMAYDCIDLVNEGITGQFSANLVKPSQRLLEKANVTGQSKIIAISEAALKNAEIYQKKQVEIHAELVKACKDLNSIP